LAASQQEQDSSLLQDSQEFENQTPTESQASATLSSSSPQKSLDDRISPSKRLEDIEERKSRDPSPDRTGEISTKS
jgi:hypothetical protein